MPKVVNAKLRDDDVITLERKSQELGYETVDELLRDFARSKVYLSETKGIPFEIDYEKLATFIVNKSMTSERLNSNSLNNSPRRDWSSGQDIGFPSQLRGFECSALLSVGRNSSIPHTTFFIVDKLLTGNSNLTLYNAL